MFTGLIRTIGTVRSLQKTSGNLRIEIGGAQEVMDAQMGASVCCSGCCLTVVDKSESSLYFDVSAESLSKTSIGAWEVMTRVNLEPSLRMGDELGGHFVFGHVDAVTEILDMNADGDAYRLKIAIPQGYAQYIASKGSLALDGISLTVNEVDLNTFGVCIIPHTWTHTTLSDRKAGDLINLEIDMLARYVARMREVNGHDK